MWQRLLRILATALNAYSFYTNPVRFITSILLIIIVPYLAYIFWGSLIVIALIVLSIYLTYRFVKRAKKGSAYNR